MYTYMCIFIYTYTCTQGCVEMLLANKADVNVRNKAGSTPLHAAATNDHLECARILVQYRADLSATNLGGVTAQEAARKIIFCCTLIQ